MWTDGIHAILLPVSQANRSLFVLVVLGVNGQARRCLHRVGLMMSSRLMPERRRARELLASSSRGASEELLVLGHGFSRRMLAPGLQQ
jgi:hypothetical protein